MSRQHCPGEDPFSFTASMDLNSINSTVTWKTYMLVPPRHLLTTLGFHFSPLKGNRLYVAPKYGVYLQPTCESHSGDTCLTEHARSGDATCYCALIVVGVCPFLMAAPWAQSAVSQGQCECSVSVQCLLIFNVSTKACEPPWDFHLSFVIMKGPF